MIKAQPKTISFIGSAGIPNRYGGFESFLEHCSPAIAALGHRVQVTCDSRLYTDKSTDFKGVRRLFLRIPANGGWSILHDLFAFSKVFFKSSHIVVLGVSGGIWFPLFRLLCAMTGKRLVVNIDGVEWRRSKFSPSKRILLRIFDYLAQRFAHHVIFDSEGLRDYLLISSENKSSCIAYPGDHVTRIKERKPNPGTALTICRIEPENNIQLLIEGALQSRIKSYSIVGNWNNSQYSRDLRKQYESNSRLKLLDPIYEPKALSNLRESCEYYLHGHSVGGTNPSLVEMIFYDCALVCFDVNFNHYTAQDCALYFKTPESLANILDSGKRPKNNRLQSLRQQYTADSIADQYIAALRML